MEMLKKLLIFVMCTMIACSSIMPVYCNNSSPETQVGGNLSDIGTKAEEALGEGQNTLYKVCIALFPIAVIILIILIVLTHNDKKLAAYIGIIGTIFIAILGVILVNNGTAFTLLEKIADLISL